MIDKKQEGIFLLAIFITMGVLIIMAIIIQMKYNSLVIKYNEMAEIANNCLIWK